MEVKSNELNMRLKVAAPEIPTFSCFGSGPLTKRGGAYAVLVSSMMEYGLDKGQGPAILRQYRGLRVLLTRRYRSLGPVARIFPVLHEMTAGFTVHLPWMDSYEHWKAYRTRRHFEVLTRLQGLSASRDLQSVSFRQKMQPLIAAMSEDLRYAFELEQSEFGVADREACDGYGHLRAYIKAVIAQASLKYAFKSNPLPYFSSAEELVDFFHELVSSEEACRQLYLNYFSEAYDETVTYYTRLAYNERLWDLLLSLRREGFPTPTVSYLESVGLSLSRDVVDTAPVHMSIPMLREGKWEAVTFPSYW